MPVTTRLKDAVGIATSREDAVMMVEGPLEHFCMVQNRLSPLPAILHRYKFPLDNSTVVLVLRSKSYDENTDAGDKHSQTSSHCTNESVIRDGGLHIQHHLCTLDPVRNSKPNNFRLHLVVEQLPCKIIQEI